MAGVNRDLVLELCFNHLTSDSLRNVSFTSRANRARVKEVVQQRLPELLRDAAAAFVTAAGGARYYGAEWPETPAARRAMAWLFNTAGRRALNETAAVEALLSAPDAIYHRIPAAALKYGFRIRFQDILAAAKRKVKGVEQWVSFMPKPEKRPLWRVVCLTSRELMVSAAATAAAAVLVTACYTSKILNAVGLQLPYYLTAHATSSSKDHLAGLKAHCFCCCHIWPCIRWCCLQHHHADAFASLLQKDPGHYLELLMVSANSVVPHAAEELLQIIKDSHSSLSICSTGNNFQTFRTDAAKLVLRRRVMLRGHTLTS